MLTNAISLLRPTPKQHEILLLTFETVNLLCTEVSKQAWESRIFSHHTLHDNLYHKIRHQTCLPAQLIIRSFGKVADAYTADPTRCHLFHPYSPITYDDRGLSWRHKQQEISLLTIEGRECIPYKCGLTAQEWLRFRRGESDLIYDEGTFYLLTACQNPDPTSDEIREILRMSIDPVEQTGARVRARYRGGRSMQR